MTHFNVWNAHEAVLDNPISSFKRNSRVIIRNYCPLAFTDYNFSVKEADLINKAALHVMRGTQDPVFESVHTFPDEVIFITSPLEENISVQFANRVLSFFVSAYCQFDLYENINGGSTEYFPSPILFSSRSFCLSKLNGPLGLTSYLNARHEHWVSRLNELNLTQKGFSLSSHQIFANV